jgi:hypothetical protein
VYRTYLKEKPKALRWKKKKGGKRWREIKKTESTCEKRKLKIKNEEQDKGKQKEGEREERSAPRKKG